MNLNNYIKQIEEEFDEFIGLNEAEKKYDKFELGKLLLDGLREYNKDVKPFLTSKIKDAYNIGWKDGASKRNEIVEERITNEIKMWLINQHEEGKIDFPFTMVDEYNKKFRMLK